MTRTRGHYDDHLIKLRIIIPCVRTVLLQSRDSAGSGRADVVRGSGGETGIELAHQQKTSRGDETVPTGKKPVTPIF